MTPKISLIAYADRDPAFIFVAVPNERGRYLRTSHAVIEVPCPQCGALVGEPCHNSKEDSRLRKYHCNIHWVRSAKAKRDKVGPVKPHYKLIHEGSE